MNRFGADFEQNEQDFATLRADDFSPARLHYRREWYVDPNVGYWLDEQGLVPAGDESPCEASIPPILDNA